MTPLQLRVKTEDRQLLSAVKTMQRDDIAISYFTTDAMPTVAEAAILFTITVSSTVAADLIKILLKKYMEKERTEKTTINNIDIKNNSAPIFIEINQYIQKQQIDENKGEKDKDQFEVIGKKID
jgi:hypothetical protein